MIFGRNSLKRLFAFSLILLVLMLSFYNFLPNDSKRFQEAVKKNAIMNLFTNQSIDTTMIRKMFRKLCLNECPATPPHLTGPIDVDTKYESIADVENRLSDLISFGGRYMPLECNARDRVAIIVPFRNREPHLPVFLKNIHPFLMKQQIEYGIFVVEQTQGGVFNRAALMNVGFLEAMKLNEWDCFVFHDIDLMPEDDRILYTCPEQPRHLSLAVDELGYSLPYDDMFGGVTALTVTQFRKTNGYSNKFWGWGGEDDDMGHRVLHVGYKIIRYPENIARYKMLLHEKETPNTDCLRMLANSMDRIDTDGLNSIQYEVESIKPTPLYTRILAEIKKQ